MNAELQTGAPIRIAVPAEGRWLPIQARHRREGAERVGPDATQPSPGLTDATATLRGDRC